MTDGFKAYRERILAAREARRAAESVRTGERKFDGSIVVTVVHPDGTLEEGVRVKATLEEGGAVARLFIGEDRRRFREYRLGAKSVNGKVVPADE